MPYFVSISLQLNSYFAKFIGEDLAKQFANLGAKLILSARNVAELERVKRGLSGKCSSDRDSVILVLSSIYLQLDIWKPHALSSSILCDFLYLR